MNYNIDDYKKEIETAKKKIKKTISIGVVAVIVLILFFSCFTTIKSGEVGIKTRFGKVVKTQLDEGINIKLPMIEKIVKMNIRVQKIELTTSSASKDLQDVSMNIAVNYRVVANKSTNLYKNVGTNYQEVVLQPAVQESIKAVTSKYTAEELITNRGAVSKDCMETLESKVKKYGLTIDNFNITDFNFSAEFNKAIEEKQVAEQKVLTAKQELEKEKIEAEKKLVKAKAEKEANEMLNQTLTEEVLMQQFIEKWDGELPKVNGNESILDITGLLK